MKQIAPHDPRPFLSKALEDWAKRQAFTQDTVDAILSDWPEGIVQIASVFDNSYKREWLERSLDRLIRLVSLHLEYATDGNVPFAVRLLQKGEILDLSKQGSALIKNLAALPADTDIEYRDHAGEQLQADYESLFWDRPNSLSAKNYLTELARRKSNKRIIDFALRLHEMTGIPRDREISVAEESIVSTVFPRIVTRKNLDSEIAEAFSCGRFDKAPWEELLKKMRGTYPHLAQTYTYEYCMAQYRAFRGISGEIPEETKEWEGLVEKKKKSGVEVRTRIVSGKCLNSPKPEVTPGDIETIVRFVRANYVTLDDLHSYCDEKIPPEHFGYFAPDTALSPLKEIWQSILSEHVPLEIAKNKLGKTLKLGK